MLYNVWGDMLTPRRTVIYDMCCVLFMSSSLDAVNIFSCSCFTIDLKSNLKTCLFVCVIDTFLLAYIMYVWDENRQNVKWICWQLFICEKMLFLYILNQCCDKLCLYTGEIFFIQIFWINYIFSCNRKLLFLVFTYRMNKLNIVAIEI